jgi:hypothetical protein
MIFNLLPYFKQQKEAYGQGYIRVRNTALLTLRLERLSGRLFTSAFFL